METSLKYTPGELMVYVHPDCKNNNPISYPAKDGDVGYDLKVWLTEYGHTIDEITINPQRMINVRTGVSIKLPHGTWGDIRSRSSTFATRKLFIMNGTIDEGYTGELSIFIWNPTLEPHIVKNGDRLAQLVICPRLVPTINKIDKLPTTDRGISGFGSTD